VEDVKAKLQTSHTAAVSEDVAKRHAEEIRALEVRLTLQHQEELKAAVDAAEKAKPAGTFDHSAAIAAAIAAHDKALQARHAEEIASAVERGRMEQATKGKLKDSQLVKSQKKVKELENQILEWRKAGILPEPVPPAPSSTPNAPMTPVQVSPTTSAVTSTSTTLPRKPSLVMPAPSVEGAARGVRGGARGTVRGASTRGLNIRGAAPGRGAPPGSVSSTATSGVSIIGAATKRARDEGETSDDSLVKRLKPAEGGGGPVTLRRPPPP